jgi:large subunit ribosomal protein L10e
MVRKPGSMYRNVRQRSFTRKKYMGGVPGSQVIHYDMGDKSNNSFPIKVSLLVEERCQIRHVALEAARVTANRHLSADAGKMGFSMKLRVYPHEVLRENKQATGAGADRVSSGMRRAFGKNVGTAARVRAMQKIFKAKLRSRKKSSLACRTETAYPLQNHYRSRGRTGSVTS